MSVLKTLLHSSIKQFQPNSEQKGIPTFVNDFAVKLYALLQNKEIGTFNLVNQGSASRFDYISKIMEITGLDVKVITAIDKDFNRKAQVSNNKVALAFNLQPLGYKLLPIWNISLKKYIKNKLMDKSPKIKVSICISVYNGESFLKTCIDSVVHQTIKEIEIILVNNGSTDLSLEIMNDYMGRFPNIVRVFSQEDRGLAQGRQTGIDNARGEFIGFLDADDYLSKDAYEKMYTAAIKHNVDLVECMSLIDGKIIQSKYKGIEKSSKILKDYFSNGDIPSMLWLRLYRSSLFIEPLMPDMYVNNEDVFALPCLLFMAKDIFYLKEQLHYHSTDNELSVMSEINNKTSNEEKIIENRVKTLYVVSHIKNFIGVDNIDNKYRDEFNTFTARTILTFCLNEFKSLSTKTSIKIACEKTDVNLKDLITSFNNLKGYNKRIQKSIKYLGFEKTVFLYRTSKKLSFSIKI